VRGINNRRGSQGLAIVFLVLATLVLSSYTLFRFHAGSSSIEESFESFSIFGKVISKQNIITDGVYLFGEEIIVTEYELFAERGDYIQNKKTIHGHYGFSEVKVEKAIYDEGELTKRFGKILKEKFKERAKKLRGSGVPVNKYIVYPFLHDFEVGYFKEGIQIVFGEWGGGFIEKDLEVRCNFPLNVSFNFRNIGLHSFEEIFKAKVKCSLNLKIGEKEIEKCFNEEMDNFNVFVNVLGAKEEKLFLVEFKSKREFFIDGELRKIKFDFVI